MNRKIQYKFIGELPGVIRNFLTSTPLLALNRNLRDQFKLSDKEYSTVLAAGSSMAMRKVLPQDLLPFFVKMSGMEEARAQELVKKIWQEVCGPIRWYFPGVEAVLAAEGCTLNEKDFFPIAQPTATKKEALDAILKISADALPKIKEKIEKYFDELLMTQEYDAEKLFKQSSGSISEGGWGLSPERAQEMIGTYRNFVGVYHFSDVSDSDFVAPTLSTIDPSTIQKSVLADHESADAAAHDAAAAAVASSPMSAQQEALVEAAFAAIEMPPTISKDMIKRWLTIIEARVRDVRDAEKTKTLLLSSEAQGGLGCAPEEAERISKLLEQTVQGFETKRTEFSVLDKIASVQQSSASLMQGPEEKQKNSQRELNERFVNMFGKSAVEEMRRETHREIESPEKAHPEEIHKTEIIVPPSLSPQQQQPEPKYIPKVPEKLKALIDAENPIFPLKSQQKPLATTKDLKKNSDIKPAASHLVGPIDELHDMSLTDFRRLSPDASVRIQKIRSKIEVIGRDGAIEKMNAIHAVEQSEPMKLYRDLIKSSLFEGKSIVELCDERKLLKQPYLEPDEAEVLKDLLQQLRYSSI